MHTAGFNEHSQFSNAKRQTLHSFNPSYNFSLIKARLQPQRRIEELNVWLVGEQHNFYSLRSSCKPLWKVARKWKDADSLTFTREINILPSFAHNLCNFQYNGKWSCKSVTRELLILHAQILRHWHCYWIEIDWTESSWIKTLSSSVKLLIVELKSFHTITDEIYSFWTELNQHWAEYWHYCL